MLRVLYIDDEPDLLEIGKLFLEEYGDFEVATATSAREGLLDLKKNSYDAIISDYQMPGMDGIELLKTLRSTDPNIPFILFTGRGREEVVIQALEYGADFYLQKGGDPNAQFAELAHKLRAAIGKRKSDELLRETNVYLTNLITNASGPIVTWDVNSRITRFNRAFEKLTAFTESEVLGKDFDILFPEASRSDSLDLICRALFGEKWESVEIPIRTASGGVRTVIWNSANIYAPNGTTPVATIAQGTDITERKKAESELKLAYEELAATEEELRQQYEQLAAHEQEIRRSREQLNTVLQTLPAGIFVVVSHELRGVNDRFCDMTGYSRDELTGQDVSVICQDGSLLTQGAGCESAGPVVAVETCLKKKDGTWLAVLLSSTPFNPEDPAEGITYAVFPTGR